MATKKESGYINPPPVKIRPAKGKGIRCGTCIFYKENTATKGQCSLVKGQLHPHGCCNLWSYTGKIDTSFSCGKDLEDLF